MSSRSESTIDVTEPFVSARERLADARAELDALLTQLADADTPRETRSIRARMDIVRAEIAAARSELENIARKARFAQVSVTVEGDGGNGGWSLGDAADDAVDVLRTAAGVAPRQPRGAAAATAAGWGCVAGLPRRRPPAPRARARLSRALAR